MKTLKNYGFVILVILSVSAYVICHHIYEEKYDGYYENAVAEHIKTAARDGSLQLEIGIIEKRIEYHHLGTDITKEYTCNGKKVKDGALIPFEKDLTFTATITEHDSSDDVGTAKIQMTLPPYTNEKTMTVRVDEKGGKKYPDAYAIWKITVEVKPHVEKLEVGFWEVIFS